MGGKEIVRWDRSPVNVGVEDLGFLELSCKKKLYKAVITFQAFLNKKIQPQLDKSSLTVQLCRQTIKIQGFHHLMQN